MPLSHYVTLRDSGLRVSPFGLGAMTFGEDWGWGSTLAELGQVYADLRVVRAIPAEPRCAIRYRSRSSTSLDFARGCLHANHGRHRFLPIVSLRKSDSRVRAFRFVLLLLSRLRARLGFTRADPAGGGPAASLTA